MYELKIETKSTVIKEPKHNIKINSSTNGLKLPVARVLSDWLSAEDRTWTFTGSVDNNTARVVSYLRSKFPEFKWFTLSSQTSFDIVSLDAGIAIELKSAQVKGKTVMGNASIYPDKVMANAIVPGTVSKRLGLTADALNVELDVLVACVERTKDCKVNDYAIIDGSYWNVTQEDYMSCKELFGNINESEFKTEFLEYYLEKYGSNSFVEKILSGAYGEGVKLDLRKLITLRTPVDRLNINGWWG